MKRFLLQTLKDTLRSLARLMVWRYRPGIIGVTGSVGKTSTKLAIKTVLGDGRKIRISAGNLNNDLGMPLTILGDWSEKDLLLVSRGTPEHTAKFKKLVFWTKVVFVSLWRIIDKSKKYPDILVLEYGADKPGDIKILLKIARPNISIITAVGDIPVHSESYSSPEEVAREKGRLIECLPVGGFAILNRDDATVMNLASRTRGRVITYGFTKGAEIQIARFENRVKDGEPVGISFKFDTAGKSVPIKIDGAFGKTHAYAAGAAAAVGLIFGMNLVKIAEALTRYQTANSRMQLLPGIKDTMIIDDAYNASPLSMHAALDTLHDLPANRKIAVLGDMLEIGKYTPEAHERIGRLAAGTVDILITVGARAKFIAEAAKMEGMKKGNIYSFDTADEARLPLQELMKKGDLVLVKASHAMELNKVVDEVKEVKTVAAEGLIV